MIINYYKETRGSVAINISKDYILDAYLDIGRTMLVCIILGIGALYFSKDTSDLVLDPLESMLKKIKSIANNPLEAAQMEENLALFDEEIKREAISDKKKKKLKGKTFKSETKILESTIIKIGALLAIGFGEAGY